MGTVLVEYICECRDRLGALIASDFIAFLDQEYEALRQNSFPVWMKDIRFGNMHPLYRRGGT
jgi:hypothetical protein